MNITLEDVKKNKEIDTLIAGANNNLKAIGYTEHGLRHVSYVSDMAARILRELGKDDHTVELASIAGWIHDVGNVVNRKSHGITGAALLYPLLMNMGFNIEDVMVLIAAVGNHEEENGRPVSDVSAALIIADKSDAHRTRVRQHTFDPEDIHDRVNYSIKDNDVEVDRENNVIRYSVIMDDTSSVMEYMVIFLSRMIMCEQAAAFLGCTFDFIVNGLHINNQNSIEDTMKAMAENAKTE